MCHPLPQHPCLSVHLSRPSKSVSFSGFPVHSFIPWCLCVCEGAGVRLPTCPRAVCAPQSAGLLNFQHGWCSLQPPPLAMGWGVGISLSWVLHKTLIRGAAVPATRACVSLLTHPLPTRLPALLPTLDLHLAGSRCARGLAVSSRPLPSGLCPPLSPAAFSFRAHSCAPQLCSHSACEHASTHWFTRLFLQQVSIEHLLYA